MREYLPAADRICLRWMVYFSIILLIPKNRIVPPRLPAKSIIDNLNTHCESSTFPYSEVVSHKSEHINGIMT